MVGGGKTIITIGRQCGSGGRKIGIGLAEALDIKCYDKELIAVAAKESGLCEEILETHDEVPTKSFLYSLVMDTYSMGYHAGHVDMPMEQKVFLAQYNAIKKIAEEESCIIVGRCADYALEDNPNVVSVFITANMEDRIQHVMKTYELPTEEKAREFIQKTDKRRANYYNYYTNKRWGDGTAYDLVVNRSDLGFEGTISLICDYINEKTRNMKKKAAKSAPEF